MAYGTPTDPVAGTVITVAYAVANLLDPIRALRTNTGGADPPGSNYWLRSNSSSSVSWVARATEVLSALGYTPVNKAGDSMSGELIFADTTGVTLGASSGTKGRLYDASGVLTVLRGHNNRVGIYNSNLTVEMLDLQPGEATFPAIVNVGSLGASGAASIGTTLNVGGTITAGAINAGAISGSAVSIGGVSVLARSSHTGTQAPATISPQGAGSGLDADNLDSTTWHAGLTGENTVGASPTTTYADLSGCSVTLDRAGTWLIMACVVWAVGASDVGRQQIVVNGVAKTPEAAIPGITGNPDQTVAHFVPVAASAGHIAKIQVREVSGGGFTQVRRGRISAIWLAP